MYFNEHFLNGKSLEHFVNSSVHSYYRITYYPCCEILSFYFVNLIHDYIKLFLERMFKHTNNMISKPSMALVFIVVPMVGSQIDFKSDACRKINIKNKI